MTEGERVRESAREKSSKMECISVAHVRLSRIVSSERWRWPFVLLSFFASHLPMLVTGGGDVGWLQIWKQTDGLTNWAFLEDEIQYLKRTIDLYRSKAPPSSPSP